ncbi:MAG: glycosyltransferase family 4 protein [Paludibacteraceae bacterium]|nr:glycosyltransferase family 4 protein [Paludibacteraceae bacterium]
MSTRTIYINARWLLHSPTGVERYAYQITKSLVNLGALVVLICPKHGKIHEAYNTNGFTIIRYGIGQSHLWEQIILPWFFLGKRNYVLLSLMGLGSICVPKNVMTVHDLSFLHKPAWFSRRYSIYYRIMMPLAIRSSSHIITVSAFSKNEILHYYPWVDNHLISVVPCAVDKTIFIANEQLREKFVLAVSSLDPRKNFQGLVNALNNTDIPLRIVGNSGSIFAKLHITPSKNITLLGYVGDEELKTLYNNASAFVFPSFYEGFGIPPLEAMASGCPVIVSDIPVMHEVCSDAAIYCDPFDETNIRQVIQEVINYSPTQLKSIAQIGYKNVQRYSWEQSAQALIDLLSTL